MGAIFLVSFLYCIAFGRAMSMCFPTEYTMFVEKKECAHCLAINTTICSGFCMTRVWYLTYYCRLDFLQSTVTLYIHNIYRQLCLTNVLSSRTISRFI
ncbi:hypothetical protein FKM82_016676 [Ascaphus truei]